MTLLARWGGGRSLLGPLSLLTLPAAGLWPTSALARAHTELPYSLEEAFSAAVRFVRIDRGCKILDKDHDAAFVTFECRDEQRARRGSFEIFRVAGGGRVRAQLTLGDDTHGMELRWLELLERKLRDERGAGLPPVKRPERDAGAQ